MSATLTAEGAGQLPDDVRGVLLDWLRGLGVNPSDVCAVSANVGRRSITLEEYVRTPTGAIEVVGTPTAPEARRRLRTVPVDRIPEELPL